MPTALAQRQWLAPLLFLCLPSAGIAEHLARTPNEAYESIVSKVAIVDRGSVREAPPGWYVAMTFMTADRIELYRTVGEGGRQLVWVTEEPTCPPLMRLAPGILQIGEIGTHFVIVYSAGLDVRLDVADPGVKGFSRLVGTNRRSRGAVSLVPHDALKPGENLETEVNVSGDQSQFEVIVRGSMGERRFKFRRGASDTWAPVDP